MPTITVVLQKAQADGTMMTRCYPNAEAHINPITNVLSRWTELILHSVDFSLIFSGL